MPAAIIEIIASLINSRPSSSYISFDINQIQSKQPDATPVDLLNALLYFRDQGEIYGFSLYSQTGAPLFVTVIFSDPIIRPMIMI